MTEHILTHYLLGNIPIIMLILALIFGGFTITRHKERVKKTFVYDTFAGYILFFVVGVACLWAFCLNIFLLPWAQGHSTWALTGGPFQLPTAGAALGLGIAGLWALHESFGFKVGVTIVTTAFYWAIAFEEVRELPTSGYFHGSTFYVVTLVPIILIILLLARYHAKKRGH